MNDNPAIQILNLAKVYKLYDKKSDRLKEAFSLRRRKYHRNFYALRNINLEIKKGEILGIVGKNGAGKSTLLQIMAGISTATRGEIKVRGNVSALLALGVGFNPERTGVENIYVSGALKGYTWSEMDNKINEILDFADIGSFAYQPVKVYSSGMKARLGFALAINMDPEILIVDEVLAVGDELFRRKCYAKMEEFFKSGCTVLYVSHSVSTVNEICTRAILLDKGELILEGPPKFVTMHYQKYLFIKQGNAEKVRNEIIRLNKDKDNKKKFTANLKKKEIKAGSEEKTVTKINKKAQVPKQEAKAFFIPDFKPKSTVVTRNYDVDISDIHIKTLEGKRVNALVMNEEYIYSFKVKFNIDALDVGVGVPFKTEKGLLITNHNLYGNFIKKVEKGSTLLIDCRFKCIFTPGIYYTNASVGAAVDEKRVVLIRIVDAMAFRVQLACKEGKYRGLVYCEQSFDIKKIYYGESSFNYHYNENR